MSNLIDPKVIKKGLELEAARRNPPYDKDGLSINFDEANKEYAKFLMYYGWLLLSEYNK